MQLDRFLWGCAASLVLVVQPIHSAELAVYPLSGNKANYIPTDVADAVRVLKTSLTKEDLQEIKEPSPSGEFFIMGTGLRNSWGLWQDSRLAKWFVAHGVNAPEDMSGVIFDALRADLKGEPFDVEKALKETHDGEMEEVEKAKKEKIRAMEAVEKIKTMMLGLKVANQTVPALKVPQLKVDDGTRVRYIAPFAGGFLIGGKYSDGDKDDDCHSPIFFSI
ncbi:MAG TPA: DUF6794 domain-containing protein [Candidatus Methylacidiphilales bacterium]|nr:DUF6794 domain-containing protein [Candidatus Methylacidiphilales bacterium]